jgi:hypothetical protein
MIVSKVKAIDISYTPHHNTLTASGRSHFSRVADGLAEFIDNSIQACSDIPENQDVTVKFFFVGETGFAVVSDNGRGMDASSLKAFATYSLDQETRGFRAQGGEHTFISKFGVGAKQAGFFLGDRIRIITKTSDSNEVQELILDRTEFDKRFKAGEEVFRGQIKVRSLSDESITPSDELTASAMMESLRSHERNHQSFTMIVMRLHPDMVVKLKTNGHYKNVADELAEIYHFHLHPGHTPSDIVSMLKFKSAGGALKTVRDRDAEKGKGKRAASRYCTLKGDSSTNYNN